MNRSVALLGLLGLASAAFGQASFEAASVKENKSGEPGWNYDLYQPDPHFRARNIPLYNLIAQAYPLSDALLAQGQLRVLTDQWPAWLASARYDIEGVPSGNVTVAQKREMLRSLLTERFKLAVHREVQQRPVFALVLSRDGKLGPQLHPHSEGASCGDYDPLGWPRRDPGKPVCGAFTLGPGRLEGQKVTIAMLGTFLTGSGRWVIDSTGLSGFFDLSLEYAAGPRIDASADTFSGPPDLITAVQQQLGLKLVPQTGPVEVIVIDHVERPDAN